MDNSNDSRREFLKIMGLSAVSLSLFGMKSCITEKEKALNFLGTGTLDIKKWNKAYKDLGTKISFSDSGNDVGPIIASMIYGTAALDYDLAGNQGGTEFELAKAKKILPWNLEKIPNWNSAWDWIKEIQSCRVNGKQYGLPIVANADSIIYNQKKIGKVVDSYDVIFDPKFKGRTAMEDSWINSVIFTAIYLKGNDLYSINDPGNLSEDELGFVMEFLIKHKKDGQFRTFWNGWEDGVRLINSQEVWAMTGWEPIVYEAQKTGLDVRYAEPREGYEGWTNNLVLHSGAEKKGHIDIAHEFVNWLMSGYYACEMAETRGYLVPNDSTLNFAKSSSQFDFRSIQEKVTHVKSKFENRKIYWQNVRPKNYKLYEEWWTKLRNA